MAGGVGWTFTYDLSLWADRGLEHTQCKETDRSPASPGATTSTPFREGNDHALENSYDIAESCLVRRVPRIDFAMWSVNIQ